MVMVNEENNVFAGVFGSVVDSQNLQIANIKIEINQLEEFIRQANEKIAEYRSEVTAIEAHRQSTLEAEQSAESALMQVQQALELIRSNIPNAETIFRSEINKIFDGQPIAYLEASVEVVEDENVETEDIVDEDINNEQNDTGINGEVDDVFEGTKEVDTETTPENEQQDTSKEEYDKTQAELELDVLKEALSPRNRLDRKLITKAAGIVKMTYSSDGTKHPKLNASTDELIGYVRKYLTKFEERAKQSKSAHIANISE